jgi:hypothetical protein
VTIIVGNVSRKLSLMQSVDYAQERVQKKKLDMMLQQTERKDIRINQECTRLSNFTMISPVYLILPLQVIILFTF